MRLLMAAITPILIAAGPAGGWSFAHWGMSRDGVAAAAHGALRPEGEVDVLSGRQALGPFRFRVKLQYDDSGLAQVDLTLTSGGDCQALGDYLRQRYGDPASEADRGAYRVMTWEDAAGGNEVNFASQGEDMAVCYLDLDPFANQ